MGTWSGDTSKGKERFIADAPRRSLKSMSDQGPSQKFFVVARIGRGHRKSNKGMYQMPGDSQEPPPKGTVEPQNHGHGYI